METKTVLCSLIQNIRELNSLRNGMRVQEIDNSILFHSNRKISNMDNLSMRKLITSD